MKTPQNRGSQYLFALGAIFLVLLVFIWWSVLSFRENRRNGVLKSWTAQEMEIVRGAARTAQAWLQMRVEQQGIPLEQAEQEVFSLFIEPIRLLQNGDAWIYNRDYIVFDKSSDMPDEYRGKSIAQIFELQKNAGAQHYDEVVEGVMQATEGTGWYIWLPQKGREYVAWTSIRLLNETWTIGLSTPESEILAFYGIDVQFNRELVAAVIGTLMMVVIFFLVMQTLRQNRRQMDLLAQQVAQRTAELAQSERQGRKYAFIVNSSLDLMSLIDRYYVYEAVNDAYCRNYGKEREQIVGKTVADVWGRLTFDNVIRPHLDRCFEGNDVQYEAWFSFEHQEKRYYEISCYPFYGTNEAVTHAVVISRDVTGEMLSEKELQSAVYSILFLNRLVETVSTSLITDVILKSLCEELAKSLNVPQAAFARYDEEHNYLIVTAEYVTEGRPSTMGDTIPIENNPSTQYVLEKCLPLVLQDVQNDPQYEGIWPIAKPRQIDTMLIVPVFVRERVFGTLGLDSIEKRSFTAEEIALVQSVASIASQALENARLYNALQETNDQLKDALTIVKKDAYFAATLITMGDKFQACQEMEEAYQVISTYAKDFFPESSGCYYDYSEETHLFESTATWGNITTIKQQFSIRDCPALITHMDHPHQILSQECQFCGDNKTEIDRPSACLCIPLNTHGNLIGMLTMRGMSTPLNEDDERFIITFSERIALSLGELRLRKKLETQSIQDPLTGLYNRRYLEEALGREIQRAMRHKRPLGILMMDIDRFKDFNDHYGHVAGDEVLRKLSEYLRDHVRADDIACRYGGEEFLIIFSEMTAKDSYQRAEELRKGIAELRIVHGDRLLSVHVSGGVAAYPEHGNNPESIIQAADLAMLRAKREGRNRVFIADDKPS